LTVPTLNSACRRTQFVTPAGKSQPRQRVLAHNP
jgi:hypothetical protein